MRVRFSNEAQKCNKIPIYHYESTISILLSINWNTFIRLYHTYMFYTLIIDFESLECKVRTRFDTEAVAALVCRHWWSTGRVQPIYGGHININIYLCPTSGGAQPPPGPTLLHWSLHWNNYIYIYIYEEHSITFEPKNLPV